MSQGDKYTVVPPEFRQKRHSHSVTGVPVRFYFASKRLLHTDLQHLSPGTYTNRTLSALKTTLTPVFPHICTNSHIL